MFVVAILLFITEKVIGELKYELFKNEFVCVVIQRVLQQVIQPIYYGKSDRHMD